ncbi:hypothetical protein C0991_003583 [Blastosporella zonata]|nr:hypothetical protein C0991_003583 [Blastosporella zonata]
MAKETPAHEIVIARSEAEIQQCYDVLSRLAVLKDYRSFRFGRELVLALHDWVKPHALSAGSTEWVEIVSHSQIPVKGFYAKYVKRTHTIPCPQF